MAFDIPLAARAPERIETARLLLRRFEEADRGDMVRFYGDPEVMAIRKYGARDAAAAGRAFDVLLAHWQDHGFGLYAVREEASGAFCGECGLRYTDDGSEIEISYGLFPDFWGQGYATEAARAVLSVAIGALRLPLLTARSRGDNKVSHAVLEKLGMRFAGKTESPGQPHGVVKYLFEPSSGT